MGTMEMLRTVLIVAGVVFLFDTGFAQTQPPLPTQSPRPGAPTAPAPTTQPGPPASPASPAPPAAAAAGKGTYMKNGCWQCHGQQAQGGTAGPRLGPRPMPLPALTAYVRKPAGEMPPYTAKVLSDRELADIHAFLSSLPAPAPVAAIPLLSGR
jgi:mono/diheme cytochrome c family protein